VSHSRTEIAISQEMCVRCVLQTEIWCGLNLGGWKSKIAAPSSVYVLVFRHPVERCCPIVVAGDAVSVLYAPFWTSLPVSALVDEEGGNWNLRHAAYGQVTAEMELQFAHGRGATHLAIV